MNAYTFDVWAPSLNAYITVTVYAENEGVAHAAVTELYPMSDLIVATEK